MPSVSHDQVKRFLRNSSFSFSQWRALVLPLLNDSPEAFLFVDDSVQDKRYSRFMEVAKRQYGGAAHGLVTGICLVNLVPSSGVARAFLPLDDRIYAPDQDQLTKNEPFQALFAHVVAEGKVQARPLLFDAWYSGSDNLKGMHRAGWTFFTTLKSNRLGSPRKELGYQALDAVAPPPGGWSTGLEVRLKQGPFAVRFFQLVAPNGDMEGGVTNHFAFTLPPQRVEATTRTRWQVEAFQRSFKQLTGAEKCPCRTASAQRNHLTCCYLAWVSLRQFAAQTAQTLYQAQQQQWAPYRRQLLQNPTIPALLPVSA